MKIKRRIIYTRQWGKSFTAWYCQFKIPFLPIWVYYAPRFCSFFESREDAELWLKRYLKDKRKKRNFKPTIIPFEDL